MTDRLTRYLSERGYANHVVQNGLEGLLQSWAEIVESVASGEVQYQDDYLNDMDGRRILEEALAFVEPDQAETVMERIRTADTRILVHLVPTAGCIWGEENARKHGYSRDRDWWYYHRPRVVDETWRDR